ncbi:hypothetical protein A8139_05675 [Marinomonas primoryensis]|uniref:Uncharacterized protein n=1 Tax=Marinomonas primoryensis TaxID=178399 RepID=A0A2Z4PPI5_9GAMM|nr:hypothetical protein [Marinomonas primoryensis]AWX99540.1 hypothetical protein A8139_05675 [Marinomonas primoryensis]
MSFYKSNSAIVPTAWKDFETKVATLRKEHEVFADFFNATPAMAFSSNGSRFKGLFLNDFESREDKDCWTKPRPQNHQISHLRAKVKGDENKAKLAELETEYQKRKPTNSEAKMDDLLESMGLNWGMLLFTGIEWRLIDNIFYVKTEAKLSENMTEILGSEYNDALAQEKVKEKANG